MCGIFGVIGERITTEQLEKASEAIAHRGPDDDGFFIDDEKLIYLAHRRLSIIDLSRAGHQPFFDANGRYQLIYNGEIYNYIEVREELKNFYTFRTETDTEVLLASYIHWGKDCVDHLNGMFAFAIWDAKDEELFCVRDRLGEKPFFYTFDNGVLRFASEIKSLLSFIKPHQNEKIIAQYLMYGFYDHSNETFFDGVYSLGAGQSLLYKDGAISIKTYWDLKDKKGKYTYGTVEDVQRQFKELLADSIKLRFRSDVPVGINLSSGLDSNTLFSYAKEVTGNSGIHLFSMCAEDEAYNECSTISSILSDAEKRNWYTSSFKHEEFKDAISKMNTVQDQPYGGIPTLAYSNLIATAKEEHVTVLLEGQGVDEFLAGYKYYRMEYVKDLLVQKKYIKFIQYLCRQKGGTFFSNLFAILKDSALSSHDYSQDRTVLIQKEILSHSTVSTAELPQFEAPFTSHLQNAQYRDIKYAKLPRVLRFNDHVTMAFGRELRLPFLDYRLAEFMFWLPAGHKISYNSEKVLSRKAFAHILPRSIQRQKKIAFGAQQTSWLRKYGREFVFNLVNSESFASRGYWDVPALKNKLGLFFDGDGDNSFYIWQIINLELWFRHYIDA